MAICMMGTMYSQPPKPTSHIEIIVRRNGADDMGSKSVPRFNKSNLRVTANGSVIPFTLSGPNSSYRKQVLVVSIDPGVCNAINSMRDVHRLRDEGWHIGVLLANPAAIQSAKPAKCNSVDLTTDPRALAQLERETGRRAVIFASGTQPELLQDVRELMSEVYVVDGGIAATSFTPLLPLGQLGPMSGGDPEVVYSIPCHEVGGKISPNDPCNLGVSTSYRTGGQRSGIFHATTLKDAVSRLAASEDRYYDLSFGTAEVPVALVILSKANAQLDIRTYSESLSGARQPWTEPLRISQAW